MVINLKVVLRELLGSADLLKAQAIGIHETAKVVMIGKDKDFIFAAF